MCGGVCAIEEKNLENGWYITAPLSGKAMGTLPVTVPLSGKATGTLPVTGTVTGTELCLALGLEIGLELVVV